MSNEYETYTRMISSVHFSEFPPLVMEKDSKKSRLNGAIFVKNRMQQPVPDWLLITQETRPQ
jgi:hypothetical protein